MSDEIPEDIEWLTEVDETDPHVAVAKGGGGDAAQMGFSGTQQDLAEMAAFIVRVICDETGRDPRVIGFDLINMVGQMENSPRVGKRFDDDGR